MFDAFEGGSRWKKVADRAYENIDAVQADHGGCSKLVYNWTDSTGAPVMPFAGNTDYDQFGWDAARVVWRVALDKIWYDSPEASETLNEMGGFFKQVGAYNIKPVYRMDGTTEWPWGLNAFFSANAGVGIWAADSAINPGATCGAAALPWQVQAQDSANWPVKPVRMLVGSAPGGGTDAMARAVADRLGPLLKQPVIVENRPGVSNTLAVDMTAQELADAAGVAQWAAWLAEALDTCRTEALPC